MASDNVLALLTGALSGAEHASGILLEDTLARRRAREAKDYALEEWKAKLPYELNMKQQESDMSLKKTNAAYDYELQHPKANTAETIQGQDMIDIAAGNPTPGKAYNKAVVPIFNQANKPEKKAQKIITAEQADQLRAAGVDVNNQDYVIQSGSGSKNASTGKDVALLKSSLKSFDEIGKAYDAARGDSGQIVGGLKSAGSYLTQGYISPEAKVYKDRLGGYVETLTKQMTGTSRNTQMVLQKAIQEFPTLSENIKSAMAKREGTRQMIVDRISELEGKPFDDSSLNGVNQLDGGASKGFTGKTKTGLAYTVEP